MPDTIVFDINETLLDLGDLRPHFARLFGDEAVIATWFGQLLRNAMVATLLDDYRDFDQLGREALVMLGERAAKTISPRDQDAVLGQMRRLPPHPEVPAALARLRDAGFRLAALSNNPLTMLEEQLAHADLSQYFDQILSVKAVRRFKPAREVYAYAARALAIAPGELRLVAAHDWDVAGAMHAGCKAAFVARPGQVMGPRQAPPDIVEADLTQIADRILATKSN